MDAEANDSQVNERSHHEEPSLIVKSGFSDTAAHSKSDTDIFPEISATLVESGLSESNVNSKSDTDIFPEISATLVESGLSESNVNSKSDTDIFPEKSSLLVESQLSETNVHLKSDTDIFPEKSSLLVESQLSETNVHLKSDTDIFPEKSSLLVESQLSDTAVHSNSDTNNFPEKSSLLVESQLSDTAVHSNSDTNNFPEKSSLLVESQLSDTAVPSKSDTDIFPEKSSLLVESQLSDTTVHSKSDTDIFPATSEDQYILTVHVGNSCIKGQVYDKSAHIKGTASRQQQLLQPAPGWCEIDPHQLVQDFCLVAQESITAAGLQPGQITCMGLTTVRASFLTWDRETGVPFHNIITWQDLRAIDYIYEWNRSYKLFALNTAAKLLYKIFGKMRYMAASVLKFMSKQVTLKLLWVLDNIPLVRSRAAEHQVMFGCIETWLLWRLTLAKSHVTDYSCASTTGLFDPFQMEWSSIVCSLVNIPLSMFPKVKDTSGDFGITDPDICGFRIPITAVVADQQGSMFGHCCFDIGDVKCTMNTGTFLNLNTGSRPQTSISGLYPIIGWKIGRELVYLAEGQSTDTGITIEWARSIGLFSNIAESSDVAESVPDSGGVFFVSSFGGLQRPYSDDKSATAIFGMRPNTTRAHLARAVLESEAFRFKCLYEAALVETKIPFSHVRVDGDVAANNFLVQMMSDVINQVIDRSLYSDMSSLGSAFLAGLARGVWSSKEDLKPLCHSDKQFQPHPTCSKVKTLFHHWENAVQRSQRWYPAS